MNPRPSGGAKCPLCGQSWYRNPAPAVGVVVVEGNRALDLEVDPTPVLLAPHTKGPDGTWVLAIGFEGRIVGVGPRPAEGVAGVRWIGAEEMVRRTLLKRTGGVA